MNTIIDTDTLLGLFNSNDIHHTSAVDLTKKALEKGINIFLLPTTLSEFALLASSRIGLTETKQAVSHLTSSDYLTVDITEDMTKEAVKLYKKQTSKEESLFDCFIMVIAKKISADCIFSFDRGYKKNGFKLLEQFVKDIMQ